MPLAEETGLIVPIGAWVLRTACGQLRAWRSAGYPSMHVAVNFSARQFQDEDLALVVAAILEQCDLAPRFLEIEITESDILKNPGRTQSLLEEFIELGVRISLDDFGTGYSSLNHLRSFPGASIKIDRSFVRNICTERHDAAIVRSLIVMAHNLNLKVIAEGVETAEQLAFLRDNACDAIQGFLVEPAGAGRGDHARASGEAPGAASLAALADRIAWRAILRRPWRSHPILRPGPGAAFLALAHLMTPHAIRPVPKLNRGHTPARGSPPGSASDGPPRAQIVVHDARLLALRARWPATTIRAPSERARSSASSARSIRWPSASSSRNWATPIAGRASAPASEQRLRPIRSARTTASPRPVSSMITARRPSA